MFVCAYELSGEASGELFILHVVEIESLFVLCNFYFWLVFDNSKLFSKTILFIMFVCFCSGPIFSDDTLWCSVVLIGCVP